MTHDEPVSPLSVIATSESLVTAIERLAHEDAAALPFIADASCEALLATARRLVYRKARPLVGEGDRAVYQDFDICTAVPATSALHPLMRVTTERLNEALARLGPRPLGHALRLNDFVVQRYAPGSSGISPHRDHARYVGIVALVVLAGKGRFIVCADRSGVAEREVQAGSGDLILMRAPGLFGRNDRPFHMLREIETERYSIGLRHDSTKVSSPP